MKVKLVAVFVPHQIIGHSPSILNLVDCLTENHRVHLFAHSNVDSNLFKSSNVKCFKINSIYFDIFKSYKMVSKSINIGKFKSIFYRLSREIKKLINHVFFNLSPYCCVISFDPDLMIISQKIFPLKKHFFYSLELYLPSDQNVKSEWIDFNYNRLSGIIIQSTYRAELLYKEFRIESSVKTFLLPVCHPFRLSSEKSKTKTRRLNEKCTILYIGWYRLDFLKEIIFNLKDYKIIINVFFKGNDMIKLQEYVKHVKAYEVNLNNAENRSIEEMCEILSQGDVGIVWYPNEDKNMYHTGYSSGKIATFMSNGIPVVCNNYPSLLESIENKNVGKCVENLPSINNAVREITKGYEFYTEHAVIEYEEKYNFRIYKDALLEFLIS